MTKVVPVIRVQSETFDVGAEIAAAQGNDPAVGAVASFVGYCRDEGGRLEALELEHYPGMAEHELTRVAGEAVQRWPLYAVTIVHRYGRLSPGEPIVLVVASSSHREAAFAAAEFLMDFLKTRAPFWKKEHLVGGGSGDWVAAKDEDDARAGRWSEPSS